MSDNPKKPRKPSDDLPPEKDARWRRPKDRFPTLPDETPPSAPSENPPRRRRASPNETRANASDRTRNLITLFFLLATFGALSYFVFIWQNPYSTLNPLAPPTPLPQVITATFTPSLSPTPAPTLTASPTYTPSEIPTVEPTFTFTPVFLEGFSTLPPDDASASYPFALQNARVIYLTNPDARGGCNWASIAGSVMNFDGTALNGYGVHVAGEGIDQTVATGSAPGFGPGGFEVPLGNASRDAEFVAQLVDPQGEAVSPVYTFETNSDCEFNIAALRFVENEPSS